MHFTQKEIKDLFFAWILLSIAFAVLFTDIREFTINSFVISLMLSALTAGIGFLFHELMHKYIAQKYGLYAEFQAFYKMIFLAIGLAFFGFIFAAPGAVFIKGNITKERNGKISLAGPMTNIVLALIFLICIFVFNTNEMLSVLFSFGLTINSLLAAFNMIPAMPFDGAKIIAWDKKFYWITLILGIGLFVLSFFV